MNERMQHDITSASFGEFVAFVFAHDYVPIPHNRGEPEPWYWGVDVEYDPLRVAGYYIKLFCNPMFLANEYSDDQLEQGFWAIQSPNLDCSVSEVIWNTKVPFEIRENCVRSMEYLFSHLFSSRGFRTSVEMWWDSLAYDWHCENRSRSNGGEDELMQDVMFETLLNILRQPSVVCQAAALHGLGHLHHPNTKAEIQSWLRMTPALSDDLRAYAHAASEFDVM